jgi:DNA gyrase/topoisomerase IV subunit B
MARKPKAYDSSSIHVLEFPDSIRKKPGLYVGGTDSRAVLHLAKEVIGNAVDEAAAGHCTEVSISLDYKTGAMQVEDNGRGIPTGPHKQFPKEDTLDVVFTKLHAGGKHDDSVYKTSLGVHGLGVKAANALSKRLSVATFQGGKWHLRKFEKGLPVGSLDRTKRFPFSGSITGVEPKRGTTIAWQHDPDVFDKDAKLSGSALKAWLEDISWFVPIKFSLRIDSAPTVIHRPNRLKDRFQHGLAKLKAEALDEEVEPFIRYTDTADVMVGWAASADNDVLSAVSSAQTTDHGTHQKALLDGIFEALKPHAKKGDAFLKTPTLCGLVAVVNVRLHGAKYSSQDKTRLVDVAAAKPVLDALLKGDKANPSLVDFFRKHKELARRIIDRSNEISRLHSEFKEHAKLAAAVKASSRGKSLLPSVLKQSSTKVDAERELFVVEGESATGSCIAARDPRFQEILPLSGKIPNVWRDDSKIATNEPIINILRSIGFDPKNPSVLRVGKIVLLSDSDVDGFHCTLLILGLLYRILPKLFDDGKVFIASTPLFIYRTDTQSFHCDTLDEAKAKVKERGMTFDPAKVNRLKGLGEAPAEVLQQSAFDLSTRRLTQVRPPADSNNRRLMISLLGDDPSARKALLGL